MEEADRILSHIPIERARWERAQVAVAWGVLGQTGRSEKAMEEIGRLHAGIFYSIGEIAVSETARSLAGAGDTAGARAALSAFGDLKERTRTGVWSAVRAIGVAEARSGDWAAARETVRAMPPDSGRNYLTFALMRMAIEGSDREIAIGLLGDLLQPHTQDRVLGQTLVGTAEARAGRTAEAHRAWGEALAELEKDPDLYRGDELAAVLADASARGGDPETFRKAAGRIPKQEQRARVLAAGAAALGRGSPDAAASALRAAVDAAAAIRDGQDRQEAMASVAAAWTALGRTDEAEKIASAVPVAWLGIAAGLVDAKDAAAAEEAVARLAPGLDRVRGAIVLAAGRMDAGDETGGRARFAEAERLARGIEGFEERNVALLTLALARAACGDVAGASRTIPLLDDRQRKAAVAGIVDRALTAVRDHPAWRGRLALECRGFFEDHLRGGDPAPAAKFCTEVARALLGLVRGWSSDEVPAFGDPYPPAGPGPVAERLLRLSRPPSADEQMSRLWGTALVLPDAYLKEWGGDPSPNGRFHLYHWDYREYGPPEGDLFVKEFSFQALYRIDKGLVVPIRQERFESWAYGAVGDDGAVLTLDHTRAGVRWVLASVDGRRWSGHLFGDPDAPKALPGGGFRVGMGYATYEMRFEGGQPSLRQVESFGDALKAVESVWGRNPRFRKHSLLQPIVHVPAGMNRAQTEAFVAQIAALRTQAEARLRADPDCVLARYLSLYGAEAAAVLGKLGSTEGERQDVPLPDLTKKAETLFESDDHTP